MRFKIFKAGFSEDELNGFFNENIVLKDKYLENGDVYVFYKHKTEIGATVMDKIEQIDRVTIQAEKEAFVAELNKTEIQTKLNDIKESISQTNPNETKEWDGLQKARVELENQIKMADATITERNIQILGFKEHHQALLNV